jgi:hypothetical protein
LASVCYINDGKGNYTKMTLPLELQLAPIYSFVSNNIDNSIIGMGNLYGVIPYEGRYDALQPVKFKFEKGAFTTDNSFKLQLNGEVRDAKWLKTSEHKQLLIVARNNQPLSFFKN